MDNIVFVVSPAAAIAVIAFVIVAVVVLRDITLMDFKLREVYGSSFADE
jgi:hypothetical protein